MLRDTADADSDGVVDQLDGDGVFPLDQLDDER